MDYTSNPARTYSLRHIRLYTLELFTQSKYFDLAHKGRNLVYTSALRARPDYYHVNNGAEDEMAVVRVIGEERGIPSRFGAAVAGRCTANPAAGLYGFAFMNILGLGRGEPRRIMI